MYKQIVSIMFTTMISFNYSSQGCTSRLSQLCLPLWFHLTIVHKDVQADCLNYVYQWYIVHKDVQADCLLCLPLFHLTIVHKDVQADCLNYVYHHDFI